MTERIQKNYQEDLPKLKTKSQLNTIITNKDRTPDHLAINIYFDSLKSWYSPKKQYQSDGNVIQIQKLKTQGIYSQGAQLAKTHGVSKETIRKKIVKLENLGLIQRSFKHKETVTTKSYNKRIIFVLKETPYFFTPHGIDKDEIKEINPQTNAYYIEEKYSIVFASKSKESQAKAIVGGIHTLEGTKELIEPFNKLKDRSMKSTFFDFKDLEEETKSNKDTSPDAKPLPQQEIQKQLKDFLPLYSKDCLELQEKSGRGFNLNAMNEILKDMSRKPNTNTFIYRIGFINYMSLAYKYEKRDEAETNHPSFKIRSNQDKEEQTIQTQEKYLTELEYSLQVSPEWHLKKKLVSVLERNKAYNLLTSFKNLDIKEGVCVLNLRKPIHLTKNDKEIILNQIQATHSNIGLNNSSILIESLNIKMPKPYVSRQTGEGAQNKTNETYEAKKDETIWGKIRSSLSNQYGEGIDIAWFSKLTARVDEEMKKITLIASSVFVTDWVKDNYTQSIEHFAKQHGFEINI